MRNIDSCESWRFAPSAYNVIYVLGQPTAKMDYGVSDGDWTGKYIDESQGGIDIISFHR